MAGAGAEGLRPTWLTPHDESRFDHRVAVSVDGELAAVAVVAERLRDSAADSLAAFDRLALPVEVLTGDAAARAAALGLPAAHGGLLPADKLARVQALAAAGRRPLMVGDGINDAAALAAAHAGVALASGTDLAVAASDATLYHGDLRVLPWAVELCRAGVRAVRRGLAAALAYNVVGVALAAAGYLHPVAAVLLMVLSSATLVRFAGRVGVRPACTARREAPSGVGRGVVHGVAVALQGLLLALLTGATAAVAGVTVAAAVVLGGLLAAWWVKRPALSHGADMAFGMLTVGNLGMLAGWFADGGFAPPACARCCTGAEPGMWLGMLAAANAAMLWLGRRPLPGGGHAAAMFGGGNVGMLVGMAAGGRLAATADVTPPAGAVALAFAGMTAGMVGGMLAGTWLAERLVGAARRSVRRAPGTSRRGGPAAAASGTSAPPPRTPAAAPPPAATAPPRPPTAPGGRPAPTPTP
ncbi:MAG: HAD-IC family P-type ATPase [Gemmataceae bacterium]